jgi:hypothetical protein
VQKARAQEGFVLVNTRLCKEDAETRAQKIIHELEAERQRVLKWKRDVKKSGFDRFRPEFPFLIEI